MPVFVDCETTGLDPQVHEIWELAVITGAGDEMCWQLPVLDLIADPKALEVSGYDARRSPPDLWVTTRIVAPLVSALTKGHALVGSQVHFDAGFLAALLKRHGLQPRWNYRLVDVESLMAGALKTPPPWDLDRMSEQLGLPPRERKHEALEDARWAKSVYEAVMAR